MSSSDVEFLSVWELESMWRAEGLSRSDYITEEKLIEALRPRECLDLALTLSYVTDSELPQKYGLKGFMSFQPKLFDRSTVVMIFECFKNLLEMAVENPHKVVWDLPILTGTAIEAASGVKQNTCSLP